MPVTSISSVGSAISTSAGDLGAPIEQTVDLSQYLPEPEPAATMPRFDTPAPPKPLTPSQTYTVPGGDGGAPQNVVEGSSTATSGSGGVTVRVTERAGGLDPNVSVTSVEGFDAVVSEDGVSVGPLISVRAKDNAIGVGARVKVQEELGDLSFNANAEFQHVMPTGDSDLVPAFDEFKFGVSLGSDPKEDTSFKLGVTATIVDNPGERKDSVEWGGNASVTQDGVTATVAGTLIERPGENNDAVGVRLSISDADATVFLRVDQNYKPAGRDETVVQVGVSVSF